MKKVITSSIRYLAVGLLCALAFVRGPMLDTVLILTVAVWSLVTALVCLSPMIFKKCRELLTTLKELKNKEKYPTLKNKAILPEVACLRFMNHVITLQVRKFYPNARWDWDVQPSKKVLFEGGTCRIKLADAGEYNYAEIEANQQKIKIKKFMSVKSPEQITDTDETPVQDNLFDIRLWHDAVAYPLVNQTLSDLSSQGCDQVVLDKSGFIYANGLEGKEEKIGEITNFPEQNFWDKVVDLFQKDGLAATIMGDKIYLTMEG